MYFALINVLLVVMVVELPFALKKAFFLVKLARSRPNSLTIHFLGIKDWVHAYSALQELQNCPY